MAKLTTEEFKKLWKRARGSRTTTKFAAQCGIKQHMYYNNTYGEGEKEISDQLISLIISNSEDKTLTIESIKNPAEEVPETVISYGRFCELSGCEIAQEDADRFLTVFAPDEIKNRIKRQKDLIFLDEEAVLYLCLQMAHLDAIQTMAVLRELNKIAIKNEIAEAKDAASAECEGELNSLRKQLTDANEALEAARKEAEKVAKENDELWAELEQKAELIASAELFKKKIDQISALVSVGEQYAPPASNAKETDEARDWRHGQQTRIDNFVKANAITREKFMVCIKAYLTTKKGLDKTAIAKHYCKACHLTEPGKAGYLFMVSMVPELRVPFEEAVTQTIQGYHQKR